MIAWPQVKNPDTMVVATIGDLETLDPAWHYDTASATAIFNIYETLVFYDRENVDKFVPQLATAWEVSADGLTYTFTIRKGVKFHAGGDLTPEDVAYSFHRALIQDRSGGPIHMLLEPILDVDSIATLAEKVGDAEALRLVQEAVKVVGDKVVIELAYPFAPFIQIVAGSWCSILDKEWVIAQGGWDGSVNWRKWHDPAAEESELFKVANGTGPFKLERWVPGEEISFVRNEDYWRGPAKLARAVIKVVPEWGTRLAMFEAGDVDIIAVPRAFVAVMDPLVIAGKARLMGPLPGSIAQSGFFNFEVAAGSPFMPLVAGEARPNLLSDVHLRRAFNYAMDLATYINESWLGEGWALRGPILEGRLGFNPDQPIYEFDLEKAEAELRAAWGGEVWQKGMRVTITYNTGNLMRKFAAEMLERNIEGFNDKRWQEGFRSPFVIEVLDLPWPTYLKSMDAGQLGIFFVGWLEDYAHPHNWVHPFMYSTGAFAMGQNFGVVKNVQFTPVHATFLNPVLATKGPVSTYWRDGQGNIVHLEAWTDTDNNGLLSVSDQIVLNGAEYHVDAISL
ncbi:MAG: ABC transporter substrate-binding protein, partial [Candidatus Acetothermia bacterium]|nr:ABC transporter substrate-binding protein [Candidatus Acetothermia bacterium]